MLNCLPPSCPIKSLTYLILNLLTTFYMLQKWPHLNADWVMVLWPPDKLCTIRNHSTCFLYKQGRKKNDENVCYVVGIGRDSMNQFKHFPFSRRSHQHNQPTIIHSFMETQNGTHSGQHNTHNTNTNPCHTGCSKGSYKPCSPHVAIIGLVEHFRIYQDFLCA